MLDTFTAIDFETAQGKRWSICQIGLIRVEMGVIKAQMSVLVQPPDNFYLPANVNVHGISPRMTAKSPTFDQVWHQIQPFITDQDVVAHNGFGFDFPCLTQTLQYYDIAPPRFTGHCTYKLFKKKLSLLCQEHRIPLNHHDALSDALACAKLFMIHSRNN